MKSLPYLLLTLLVGAQSGWASDSSLACHDPLVRQGLKQSWERMAKRMQLPDSTRLQLWNLRDSSDFCRADFVASRPGVRVGGILGYRVMRGDSLVVTEVGKPKFTLFVIDSTVVKP
jgi:hypothetical protein